MNHRVLLGVGWYFPESLGGTEVYVRGLARHLRERGVDVAIAAPLPIEGGASQYVLDGIPVFRYSSTSTSSISFDSTAPAPKAWCDILDRFKPNTVDIHSLIPGLGLEHLKAAVARRARALVTIHVPEVLCARGTFLRFGSSRCDGDLGRQPCTACRLEARGVSGPARALAARIPSSVGHRIGPWPLPRNVKRLLSASMADASRRAWFSELATHADCLVAVSGWLAAALIKNGVPADRVRVCPQGVEPRSMDRQRPPIGSSGRLRVGFVGRAEPRKGLHVLLDAAGRLKHDSAIEFHIWCVARTDDARAYRAGMIEKARGNDRVIFHAETTTPHTIYDQIDVLAVPSVGFETGPFVVLEAQAAGVPIIGSDLGGISERVVNDRDGLLVPPGDPAALAEAIERLARDSTALAKLRPTGAVRSMADVANDTIDIYERVRVNARRDVVSQVIRA
jgi:glycosyltransferase involved in cell wall biosynthesis